jgi:hypothetical protein
MATTRPPDIAPWGTGEGLIATRPYVDDKLLDPPQVERCYPFPGDEGAG